MDHKTSLACKGKNYPPQTLYPRTSITKLCFHKPKIAHNRTHSVDSIDSRVLLYSRVASYPLHRYAKQSHFSGRSRSHPPAPRPRPTPAQHATTLMECPPCRCNRCGAGRASSVHLAILGRHDALDQPAEHWEHGDDQRENDRHRAHRHCKMRRETGAHSAEAEAEALKCAYLNAP